MIRYRLIRDDGIVKIFEKNEFYEAQEAQSWCELASIGEVYDGNGFEIEVISN